MPSLMGHDSDHPRSLGEVGREGVAIDTLDDMQTLFAGIDLARVHATEGEVVSALQDVWGSYTETPVF
jgi:methylmalonyl-CoA mutase N-terminal domain/subunit